MNLQFYDGALRRHLAAVAHELANMVHTLKERDPSNDNHESVVERHARRAVEIRRRIDAELKKDSGITLALLKAEFERDLNGILGELLAWQERLDARSRDQDLH